MNYHLTLEFLGTNYSGWLYQPDKPSVQEALQRALEDLLSTQITLVGCSRTDSGVHALNYHAHFKMKDMPIPLENFCRAINPTLPKDIVVKSIHEESASFHPILSAKEKTYRYTILNTSLPSVFVSETSSHVTYALDEKAMMEAAQYLEGEYDFRAFCTEPETKKNHVRKVNSVLVRRDGDFLLIDVTARGFLYNMVRIIVGTLLDVGRGHIDAERVPFILESRDRNMAGPTAPAKGLCLIDVIYKVEE